MCDSNIHDELINLEQSTCPFCDQLLVTESAKEAIPCCSKQDIENNDGIYVCLNCGLVHSYTTDNEYIDFYENIYKIHRKSIYHRKYHIQNILNGLLVDQRVELNHDQRDRIYKVFVEIGTILNDVNRNRKRMISTKFIVRKILEMMRLPYNKIQITKSKKTLAFYDKYWVEIMTHIGNKIITIIK